MKVTSKYYRFLACNYWLCSEEEYFVFGEFIYDQVTPYNLGRIGEGAVDFHLDQGSTSLLGVEGRNED